MRALRFICGLWLWSLLLGGTSCIGGQTGSESKDSSALDESEPCDPFAPQPDAIEIEYLARGENGALLLALRPSGQLRYEDVRLFYGEDGTLIEREVASFERQRDGGTTHILFDLDGMQADALFPFVNLMPGQATLTVRDETSDLEWLDPNAEQALLAGAGLRCLKD